MGRLIPAGTGFEWYRHVRIPADEPPPPTAAPQPTEDNLDLDREREYLVEPEEALGPPEATSSNRRPPTSGLKSFGPAARTQGAETQVSAPFFTYRYRHPPRRRLRRQSA